MSHKFGADLGGINSVAKLMGRCYVDQDTGCWHWRLSMSQGAPRVHVRLPDGSSHVTRGRRAALMVKNGCLIAAKKQVFAKACCQSPDCVNPEHARIGTKHHSMQAASARGALSTPARLASIKQRGVEARRLTGEQMQELLSNEQSAYAVAKKFSLSQSRVSALRAQGGYIAKAPDRISSVWDLGRVA